MHLERGPSGITFVFVLQPDMTIVPHAFDRMRSDGVPFVLPIYLRDVFGERQICADVTGLCPLIDLPAENIRKDAVLLDHMKNFFAVPVLMEDYFLSADFLLTDPRFIFWDAQAKSMYWLAIPVEPTRGILFSDGENLSVRIQKILSSPFFGDFFLGKNVAEWLAHIDLLEEELYLSSTERMFSITEPNPELTNPQKTMRLPFVQWQLFVIAGLSVLLFWFVLAIDRISVPVRHGLPIVAFSVSATLLLLLLMTLRKKPSMNASHEQNTEETVVEDIAGSVLTRIADISVYPDAFIVRIDENEDSANKKSNWQRYPMLLQDCLIGRDSILCDIFLDDPSVSDRHARILKRSGTYFLMDTGSISGTILEDRKLYSYEENPLTDQDRFSIGNVHFVFHTYQNEGGL